VRAVARSRRRIPREVRQCSGKRCNDSMRAFLSTSKHGIEYCSNSLCFMIDARRRESAFFVVGMPLP
jgi:hypothetical protein